MDAIDSSEPWRSIQRWIQIDLTAFQDAKPFADASGVQEGQLAFDAKPMTSGKVDDGSIKLSARAKELASTELEDGDTLYLPVRDRTFDGIRPAPFAVLTRPDGTTQFLDSCIWVQDEFDRVSTELVNERAASSAADVVSRLDTDTVLRERFMDIAINGTTPTTLQWALRTRDARSVYDGDASTDLVTGMQDALLAVDVPNTWMSSDSSLAICTRTSVAWNSCVSLRPTEQTLRGEATTTLQVSGLASPGEPLEVVIGDLSKAVEEGFVASLGKVVPGTRAVKIAGAWPDGLDVGLVARSSDLLEAVQK